MSAATQSVSAVQAKKLDLARAAQLETIVRGALGHPQGGGPLYRAAYLLALSGQPDLTIEHLITGAVRQARKGYLVAERLQPVPVEEDAPDGTPPLAYGDLLDLTLLRRDPRLASKITKWSRARFWYRSSAKPENCWLVFWPKPRIDPNPVYVSFTLARLLEADKWPDEFIPDMPSWARPVRVR